MIYIFWTCRDQTEARNVIHLLLEKKLIACASIVPEILSIYRWQGKIEENKEAKVILKTQAKHFEAIQNIILETGSYEVPEISQISVLKTNPDYLAWIAETCE